MSRPDSIDSLLNGPASEIAPTVTGLKKQEQSGPAAEAKIEPVKDKPPTTRPKKPNPVTAKPKQEAPAQSQGRIAAGQPIRVQISTSDGSEIAAALEEVRSNIPAVCQRNFNLGAFFRDVLQSNDAEIARMILESVGRG